MSHNRQHDTDRSGNNHDQRSQRPTKAHDQRAKVQAQNDRGNRPGDVGNQNPADDHNDRKRYLETIEIERQLDTSLPIPDDAQTIREGAENEDALVAADETEVDEKAKKKKGAQPSYGRP